MTAPLEPHRLRWCFSTLGCADLSFGEVCEIAREFSIPGIELRGLGGRLDMPDYCAEQGLTPERVEEACRRHRTQVVVAGSSVQLTSASEKGRREFVQFCAWAEALHIPYVRVFGGGTWGDQLTDADYRHAVDLMNWWRDEKRARDWNVELLLETHDAFAASQPCLELNRRLSEPLHLIWDSHHTWRIGGESPAFSWDQLGPLIRHVHIKDSVDRPSARHPYTYVLPGEGQMPMLEVVELLRTDGFKGFASLEWERTWHPYLAPIPEALSMLRKQPWFQNTPDDLVTTAAR